VAKVALLIGVSEYREGLKLLPAALKDVEAMQEMLQNPEMGGFDEVKPLINPNRSRMEEEIEIWLKDRQPDDLLLLFFSGHGVKDESRDLYFATCNTRKDQRGELIKSTAVPASFVRNCLKRSKSKRQVVILDCCFSGAFGDLVAKDDSDVDLESQLGTEGGVVLTSSSSLQYSFEQEGSDLSIYTRYLVEGIRTGAADQDGDGAVSVDELHQFASKKVQEAAPAMTPKIIVLKDEGYKIKLAKAPTGDPKLKYRKEAERCVDQGKFTIPARKLLNRLRDELGLTSDEAEAIEDEVLQPYREHQRKFNEYEETLAEALQEENPLNDRTHNDLRDYQKHLGLSDEDVEEIEKRLTADRKVEYQKQQQEESERPRQQQPSLQITSSTSIDETDILSSVRGVDYTKLRDLLATGQWKEADRETDRVMRQATGQEDRLLVKSIRKFASEDLNTINKLWLKYSNGHFGFSVQKRIWESVGGTPDADYETFKKFAVRIGWLKRQKKERWLAHVQLNFDLSAPKGHLPFFALSMGRGWYPTYHGGVALLSRKDLSPIIF
jgi:uncharacterized caspase-like protein